VCTNKNRKKQQIFNKQQEQGMEQEAIVQQQESLPSRTNRSNGIGISIVNSDESASGWKEELLKQMSNDYAQWFDLSQIQSNGIKHIEETVDGVLTRLDEFGEHLDYIHTSTDNISRKILPQLLLLSSNLQFLYKKIDIMHEYVHQVQGKVEALEVKVSEIEKQELSSTSALNKYIPKMFASWRRGGSDQQDQSQKSASISFHASHYQIHASQLAENIKAIEEQAKEYRNANLLKRNVEKQKAQSTETSSTASSLEIPVDQAQQSQTATVISDESVTASQAEPVSIRKETGEEEEEKGEEEEGEEEEGKEEEGEEEEGEEEEGEEDDS
jgi:hypothetical protein